MNGDKDYSTILSMVEKIVEKKVYEILDKLGIESSDYGEIDWVSDYTTNDEGETESVIRASVMLPSGERVDDLYNASGEILEVGDRVKIFGSRTNMSNRYIGMKYTEHLRESEVVSDAE